MENNDGFEKQETRTQNGNDAQHEAREQLLNQKIALTDKFLVLNQIDLPEDKIPILRAHMLHCSLGKLQAIQGMSCRHAYNMQFISFILGWSGIDRMLIGDIGLGLLKLFTFGGFGILMLFDWLTIIYQTRYYNYLQVMSVLDYDDYESPNP